MNKVFYAGIGSRETPLEIKNLMTEVAMYLSECDWILRSGGAGGADEAFELGAGDKKEIYIPNSGFNSSKSIYFVGSAAVDPRAEHLAERVWNDRWVNGHVPIEWANLKLFTKKLMTRNMYQVCGANLETTSRVVICYTKDGKASGGTGQALHAVKMMRDKQDAKPPEQRLQVPQIVNLYYSNSVEVIRNMLRNNINPNNIWPEGPQ